MGDNEPEKDTEKHAEPVDQAQQNPVDLADFRKKQEKDAEKARKDVEKNG